MWSGLGPGRGPQLLPGISDEFGRVLRLCGGQHRVPTGVQRSGSGGKRRSSGMSEFSPFWAKIRDMELATTKSGIKSRGHRPTFSRHICPQCGQLRESLRPRKWGQKWQRKEILRSLSRSAYAHKKKGGVTPKKGGLYEPKREIRPLPDA